MTVEPRSFGALMSRIRAQRLQILDRTFASDPVLAPIEVTGARYIVLNRLRGGFSREETAQLTGYLERTAADL
jgi:hypothetical protein